MGNQLVARPPKNFPSNTIFLILIIIKIRPIGQKKYENYNQNIKS